MTKLLDINLTIGFCLLFSLTSHPRVSLLGSGNMAGETMLFEVNDACQSKYSTK